MALSDGTIQYQITLVSRWYYAGGTATAGSGTPFRGFYKYFCFGPETFVGSRDGTISTNFACTKIAP